jgi:hypothetical protein
MINVRIFEEIVSGWSNLAFKTKETEELAKKRLKFCVDCTQFRKNKTCAICGCYIPAKTRSDKPQTHCPMNIW